ncbi:endonuclease/exonuclease/phosphatase family protein [Mesorhizobium sp. Mes31]|uniref:endonuclease/exonuclease/phosphatase family protein n=1 Tax=Mesorhizobium sp. Mes31 TaxID=2926017 RepID=UPI002118EC53|nr:endonuclease/exonuclease/phosphatase family protein [Mesorhizobium sp. Mes31]
MSASIRVLTYNVQMRSWAMEAGAQGSLTPYENVEDRAKLISKRVLGSEWDYDVLCFQEVFDEDGRDALISHLKGKYPFRVEKAQGDSVSTVCATLLGVAGYAATIPGGAALSIVAGVIGLILIPFSKFEDSGLMIFSRIPFDGIPVPAELQDIVGQDKIPIVAFVEYEDSVWDDSAASKGVLYAKLVQDGKAFHLLNSHTQADATDNVEAHKDIRRKQLNQAFDLIKTMTGNVEDAEILMCGDLNIDGMSHPTTGFRQEWTERFNTPGAPFTKVLHDSWMHEQSPGDVRLGMLTLPDWFDRGMTVHNQRLDYALRGRGPLNGRRAMQHMCIAYDIATDATNPTSYVSDHLPVRIDLDLDRPFASIATSEQINMPIGSGDKIFNGFLVEGQMHWICIKDPGGYAIDLTLGGPDVRMDIFTADNLSVPVKPFSIQDEGGPRQEKMTRFALPLAPFLIRVAHPSRRGERRYRVRVHRYAGTSRLDAIPLQRNVPFVAQAKVGAPHSLNDPSTPDFDEMDTVWFCAALDTEPDGSLNANSTISISNSDMDAFGLLVVASKPGSTDLALLDKVDAGPAVVSQVGYDRPLNGYFLAQRQDPSFTAERFTITLKSNVSYLYGNPNNAGSRARTMARLFCRDETDGFLGSEAGSDDIQINVSVGGQLRVHIPNGDELEFDDDSFRDLPQINMVRYIDSAEFELVELDDLSPADRTSIQIPSFDMLANTDKVLEGIGASLTVQLSLVFNPAEDDDDDDDGVYDLQITVSCEPPP